MAEQKVIAVVGATGAQGGGLARAIANDADGEFRARALTRDPHSEQAAALAALPNVEVVEANLDDPASIEAAFRDAYGAFCVTFFSLTSPTRVSSAPGRTFDSAGSSTSIRATSSLTQLASGWGSTPFVVSAASK